MSRQVNVISADLDGAQLGRRKRMNSLCVRCEGKNDDQNIQDAIYTSQRGCVYSIRSEDWERVFGSRK